jgi:hypothetical protein
MNPLNCPAKLRNFFDNSIPKLHKKTIQLSVVLKNKIANINLNLG